MSHGDFDAAATAFQKAIAAGDRSAATWTLLANVQMRRADYSYAEAATYSAYQAATNPADKAAALVRLGRILEKARGAGHGAGGLSGRA